MLPWQFTLSLKTAPSSFCSWLSRGFCVSQPYMSTAPPTTIYPKTMPVYLDDPYDIGANPMPSKLSKQLGRPTQSLAGWIITKFMEWYNRMLEENAVRLCGIRPDDTVLELGHGPGLGLVAAAPLLSGPKGKLIGVDYSDYMHQLATKKVKELIACGKVTLHHGNVEAMPIPDNSVDKVYHCNCYYFWPDLREGSQEILRVMKSGGLMVTTLRLQRLVHAASRGAIPPQNWHPETYMEALRTTGFTDVHMEEMTDRGINFQAIFATAYK